MAAKKKGAKGAVKSAAVAAKEAELTREADLLRAEKDRERLRNEEAELRQRIEEEERKLLDSHLQRERELYSAIAERDRKAYYDARERELLEQADQRERVIRELQAKLLGVQQAQQYLEQEKESAVRKAAMLHNELELAQMRHLETEAMLEANEQGYQDARRKLEEQYDELSGAMTALRAEHEALRGRFSEQSQQLATLTAPKTEVEALAERDLTDVVPQSADAETVVLLKVLQGDVERYKTLATRLQSELDHIQRDEEKASLLVSILNTQLDSVREDNKRLYAANQNRLSELKAVETLLDEEKAKKQQVYEELDTITSDAAVERRQLELEVQVHKSQVKELTSRLDEATQALRAKTAAYDDFVACAVQREREDLEVNTAMKGEVDQQKRDIAQLLREKETIKNDAFDYRVLTRAEMDSLKTRLKQFQETLERKERVFFQETRSLQTECDQVRGECQQLTTSHKQEVQRLSEELEDTKAARTHWQTQFEDLQSRSTATEKELYEKLVHMTACHDSKHEELERLRVRLHAKEEEFTHNTICLSAEKENLAAKVETLQQEARTRRQDHLQHIDRITSELTTLQARLTKEVQQQEEGSRKQAERADLAERNVQRLTDRIREMESDTHTLEINHEDVVKALKADCRELRSELSIAKRTIERLEGAMGDQAGYKQLTEHNEQLRKEVDQYRQQATQLATTVSSMKVEQDLMGGYKLQKAMDENDQLLRRVQRLEREQKLTMPLFRQLRSVAEQGYISDNLRTALERYDAQAALGVTMSVKPVPSSAAADQVGFAPADSRLGTGYGGTAGGELLSTMPAVLRPRKASKGQRSHGLVEKLLEKTAAATADTSTSVQLPSIHA